MAGVDDNISMFGDWSASNPSPRTLFASFLGNNLLPEDGSEILLIKPEKPKNRTDSADKNEDFEFETGSDMFKSPSNVPDVPKSRLGGGLSERVAAKAGFNALKINISHTGAMNLSSPSSDARSSRVTIPPGLSPTTLLESPVFFFNNMIQPSPTTGKFSAVECNGPCSVISELAQDKVSDVNSSGDTFTFRPVVQTDRSQNMVSMADFRSHLMSEETSACPEFSGQSGHLIVMESIPRQQLALEPQPAIVDTAYESSTRNEGHFFDEQNERELKGDTVSTALEQQSEDEYNWRKYGQKQVKGSEHPRSYYKCTYPNCDVKKKVEQSPEGRVVEIIYKGKHMHPKPPPNRRTSLSAFGAFGEIPIDGSETSDHQLNTERKRMWTNTQSEIPGLEWRNDGMDASSSVSIAAEFCNPSPSINTQDDPRYEYADAIDVSSTMSNEEEEQVTLQSTSLAADGDNNESDSKRSKLENSFMDVTAAARAVNREPRVVVQTTSEVDILDDGYRWRKYGQKVVKGNPNPRSYYKCTSAGCPVRKHVERASHDLKSVITTYEGKHNHEVPAARNSSNSSSNSSSMGGSSVSQSHINNKRLDHSQLPDGYSRFSIPTIGSYGMHRVEQPGPSSDFSFGLGQPGIASLAMARYGPAFQAKTMIPMNSYFGQHPGNETGMVLPKGELEEPMAGSSMPIANNAPVYQQYMGGLTLGPQI